MHSTHTLVNTLHICADTTVVLHTATLMLALHHTGNRNLLPFVFELDAIPGPFDVDIALADILFMVAGVIFYGGLTLWLERLFSGTRYVRIRNHMLCFYSFEAAIASCLVLRPLHFPSRVRTRYHDPLCMHHTPSYCHC
jgi:hypothetical protein